MYIDVLLRTFHIALLAESVILPCSSTHACAFVFACAAALFTDSGGHVRKSATLSLTLTPMKRIQSSPNLYTLTGIRNQITLIFIFMFACLLLALYVSNGAEDIAAGVKCDDGFTQTPRAGIPLHCTQRHSFHICVLSLCILCPTTAFLLTVFLSLTLLLLLAISFLCLQLLKECLRAVALPSFA